MTGKTSLTGQAYPPYHRSTVQSGDRQGKIDGSDLQVVGKALQTVLIKGYFKPGITQDAAAHIELKRA